jgi:hypothetical protein
MAKVRTNRPFQSGTRRMTSDGKAIARPERAGDAEARNGWTPVAARPDAGFLAHLLAVRHDMPAQRQRRRAAPETAAARYRAVAAI